MPINVRCQYCKRVVSIPQHRLGKFRFCSRSCGWNWHNENDRTKINCEICGKEFDVINFRKTIAKYCSRECYYKAMTKIGSIDVECFVCGKKFKRSPSQIKTKYKKLCCSIECRGKLMRTQKPGGATTSRKWLETRGKIEKCERCGYSEHPEILVVHHRDRDRKNNDISNLEILCPNCHAMEHYSQ